MSQSTKQLGPKIRYLVTGTQSRLGEEEIEDKLSFHLSDRLMPFLKKGYEYLESDLPQGDYENTLKNKVYTVYLRERVTIVFPSQPKEAGSTVENLDGLAWPAGLTYKELNQTCHREISYRYEDGEVAFEPTVETIEFERSAMVNHVTNQVSYMPWQIVGEGGFGEVEPPELLGYRVEIEQVDTVGDDSMTNQEVVVTYIKEIQHAKVIVKDQSSGAVLYSELLEGRTHERIAFSDKEMLDGYEAQGYEVLQNPLASDCYFGSDTKQTQELVIMLSPKEIWLDLNNLPRIGQPVYPENADGLLWSVDVSENQLTRTVSRTIVSQHENGELIDQVEQVVSFGRKAKINLLSQKVSFMPWELLSDTATFPQYIPQDMPGYAPKPRKIPEIKTVTLDSANATERIIYTRKIQRAVIEFVDQQHDDQVLYSAQVVGRTGETIRYDYHKKIQEFINNGYEVVDNGFPKDAVYGTAGESDQIVYRISLKPMTVVVSSASPKIAGTYIDSEAKTGAKWPVGVDELSLKRYVTRTIKHLFENGNPIHEAHVDQILFEREAEVNLVTGHIGYSSWRQTGSAFEDYIAPEIKGFYSNTEMVSGISDITVDSPDFDVVIYYSKLPKRINCTIVDQSREETLEECYLYGKASQRLKEEINEKLIPYVAKGYRLENEEYIDLVLKNPDKTAITVELTPVIHEVTSKNPQQPYSLVEGYDELSWPSGLEKPQLLKTVSRVLSLVYDNGQKVSEDVSQQVEFSRTAFVNLVTREVSYGEWTSANPIFPEIELPELEGYHTAITVLPEEAVSVEQLDQVSEVIYYVQPNKVIVEYIDDETEELLTKEEFIGNLDDRVDYPIAERLSLLGLTAYEVISHNCPEQIFVTATTQSYAVRLKAKTVTITHLEACLPYTFRYLDGYGLFTWPEGVDKGSLEGTIRRRISYADENGEALIGGSVDQVVHLNRSATINLVTKEVTYSPWEADTQALDSVESPVFAGYIAQQSVVPELSFDDLGGWINKVVDITVTYTKQPLHGQVTLVDTTRNVVLESTTIRVSDKEAVLQSCTQLLERYRKQGYVAEDGQIDISAWAYDVENQLRLEVQSQVITVSLEHVKERFTSFEAPIAELLKGLSGLSPFALSREITRRIRYLYADGKMVAPEYKDSVLFKRLAHVNITTGDIAYEEWTSYYPIFDEVLSPIVEDYTPSKEIVGELENISAESQGIVETIIYRQNIQQVVVNVIDKSTGHVIYAESITGSEDDTLAEDKVSEFVKKSYDYVSYKSPVEPIVEPTSYDVHSEFQDDERIQEIVSTEDGSELLDFDEPSNSDVVEEDNQEVEVSTETATLDLEVSDQQNEVIVGQSRLQKGLASLLGAMRDPEEESKGEPEASLEPETPVEEVLPLEMVEQQELPKKPVHKSLAALFGVQKSEKPQKMKAPILSEVEDFDDATIRITLANTDLQARYGLSATDLTLTLVREIHFVDEEGENLRSPLIQSLEYRRDALLDREAKDLRYTQWTPVEESVFSGIPSPLIEGYVIVEGGIETYTPDPDGDAIISEELVYRHQTTVENISLIFLDDETEEELLTFNFVDQGDAYCEKKINKGLDFLERRGYELVATDYPTGEEWLDEDTRCYRLYLTQVVDD